jgi:hypothetical protein
LPLSRSFETPRFAEAPANEAIVRVNEFGADFGLGAAKTDVRNLVLAAGTRAAAEMNPDFAFVPAALRFELIDEFDHPVLGLGNGEVAKLDTRATHAGLCESCSAASRVPASVNSR